MFKSFGLNDSDKRFFSSSISYLPSNKLNILIWIRLNYYNKNIYLPEPNLFFVWNSILLFKKDNNSIHHLFIDLNYHSKFDNFFYYYYNSFYIKLCC